MRRGTVRSLVLTAILGLMVAGVGPVAATGSSSPNYSGTLASGWSTWDDAKACVPYTNCETLKGVAFAEVDISDAMAHYEDWASFSVSNPLVSYTTLWYVCSYDDAGERLQCWQDGDRDWGLLGQMGPNATTLRLFPVQSAPNAYYLSVWVD